MFLARERRCARGIATVLALAAALGAAGCGSSDDGGGSDEAVTTTRSGGDPNGTPEEQVTAAYDAFISDFYAKRPDALCGQMTAAAQERFGGKRPCQKRFDTMFKEETFVPDRPYVVQADVKGDKAVVRVKTKKSNTYPVPLRKEDGAWKISGGFAAG